jgi:peptidyl-prolyl cis-trans isomerase C
MACKAAPADGQRSEKSPEPPEPAASTTGDVVLARFDDHALTVREFEARLGAQPPEIRARYASAVARERLLDDMVQLELLLDEAKRRGLDRTPRVKDRIAELVVEEMMNGLFGSEGAAATQITDDEVRRYHEAHSTEFHSPEERRAMDLVFADRQSAESALRQIARHPGDEPFFRTLARDESPGRASGAGVSDLGFFSAVSANRPADPLREAVFQLRRVGDVVQGGVESDGRFHVLMLTGLRPAIVRSLPDVQTLIRARLAQDRRREAISRFTDDLRARAHPVVHKERLPAPAAAPSASSVPAASSVPEP